MNALIYINGNDVTNACRLQDTRINYDSSKRITTAQITVMGRTLGREARYDYAHYDEDSYSIALRELYQVTIFDGRDGVTKLFDGQITALDMEQSDGPTFEVFYKVSMNDWAAWLDRAVCWDSGFMLPLPSSDQNIIAALLSNFCPKVHLNPDNIAELVPVIESFDWLTKTCRQVLDDVCTLSMGEWRIDFDANLYYGPASAARPAPYNLSTSPDYVSTFPVRVEGYRHDFSNPINHAYVRGAVDPASGIWVTANYSDPVSVATYGEYSSAVVDQQITTGWDAALRAKSMVLQNAYPTEQGNFTVWTDDLQCGMQVHITEENLGIDGDYTIRALSLQWEDNHTVRYEAQFGAAQPDLETVLRLLQLRARWQSSTQSVGSPAPGSVTDASIAAGGLHAESISTVNANTIMGAIQASQIATVNAGAIVGAITSDQIAGVKANTIQGAIVAGQIGSVSATTIQGVVVSSQLADGIIDDLAKYATALRPVPMLSTVPTLPDPNYPPDTFFYYVPDGHFYRINSAGTGWTLDDNPQNTVMKFYHIGAISASSITGLIVAAQIGSITAGQITGQIQASQIQAVNASSINGQVNASQISTVNASSIQGSISASQIATINATQITGSIIASQISTVNATTITIGQIVDGQIANISASKLTLGTLQVGAQSNMPGVINVYGPSSLVAQIGILSGGFYGGWFQVFGAGGTGYADAKVKTDAGNLFLTDCTLNISNQIKTSPTTFDSTYSTLALNNDNGTDKASFISRGMVFYYAGGKIGSLIRTGTGGTYLELEMNAGGSSYVLINGPSGVRSDQGFAVGGARVINSSGAFTGAGVSCLSNGIAGAGFNPFIGGTQYFGVSSGSFTTADGKTATVRGGVIVALG